MLTFCPSTLEISISMHSLVSICKQDGKYRAHLLLPMQFCVHLIVFYLSTYRKQDVPACPFCVCHWGKNNILKARHILRWPIWWERELHWLIIKLKLWNSKEFVVYRIKAFSFTNNIITVDITQHTYHFLLHAKEKGSQENRWNMLVEKIVVLMLKQKDLSSGREWVMFFLL